MRHLTLEQHSIDLQRKVYELQEANDRLRIDHHNLEQNYKEVKELYLAVEHVNEEQTQEIMLARESLEASAWDVGYKTLMIQSLETTVQVEKHISSQTKPKDKLMLSFKKQYQSAM